MKLACQKFDTVEGTYGGHQEVAVPVHERRLPARWELRLIGPAGMVLLSGFLVIGMSGCGPRRLNVVHTVHDTLLTVGYSADRSQSIFRADNEAQMYCERQEKGVVFINQDTVYQGRYNEDVTAAARTAGRVAGALGSSKAATASQAMSSPTDYKTTFEFVCK